MLISKALPDRPVPDKTAAQTMEHIAKVTPFNTRLGTVGVSYSSDALEHPQETPQQRYVLELEHLDHRPTLLRYAQERWGQSKPRPVLGGYEQYQSSSLRGSLLRMGLKPKETRKRAAR